MTAVQGQQQLSRNDEQILTQVFDPESSPDTPQCNIDPSLPADSNIKDDELLRKLKKWELEAIMPIEEYSVSSSKPAIFSKLSVIPESAQYQHAVYVKALDKLNSLIDKHPKYASAYNNRAQVRRWRYSQAPGMADAATLEALELSVKDLDTAISLATPPTATTAISPAQAKLLANAWTQRGAVLLGLARRRTGSVPAVQPLEHNQAQPGDPAPAAHSTESQNSSDRNSLQSWDKTRCEEEGSRSFFMAGIYGSDIGRSMAVKTNPYARLCGSIVKEALKREGAI